MNPGDKLIVPVIWSHTKQRETVTVVNVFLNGQVLVQYPSGYTEELPYNVFE